jgi:hypothetical protein
LWGLLGAFLGSVLGTSDFFPKCNFSACYKYSVFMFVQSRSQGCCLCIFAQFAPRGAMRYRKPVDL